MIINVYMKAGRSNLGDDIYIKILKVVDLRELTEKVNASEFGNI